MSDEYIKKYWIKYYPVKYIRSLILLAIEKLPKVFDNTVWQIILLKDTLYIYDNYNKNKLYLLRQYVSILTKEQLDIVGW
jgi:hypothetical protein